MCRLRIVRALLLTVAMAFLTIAGALAQTPPRKVYVPDFTGDVPPKMAAVLASEVSTALFKAGVQAFTETNLSDQLKQEKYKDFLNCEGDARCTEEIISGYGIADRLFGKVTRLGREWHMEITLAHKGAVVGKENTRVTCAEKELGAVAVALALRVLGLAGVQQGEFIEEVIGGAVTEWRPQGSARYIVKFESSPVGGVVMVDGDLVCQDTAAGCSRMLNPGRHRVTMQKEKYVKRTETIDVAKDVTVRWELEENFGRLTVKSTPPGLEVRVNRKAVGRTPVTKLELPPGAYEVLLVSDCYHKAGKKVALGRGESEVVDVSPAPIEGAIDVTAVDEQENALRADVYVDGVKVGTAPGRHKVSVCAREVEVRAPSGSWKQSLKVREKKTVVVKALLPRDTPERVAVGKALALRNGDPERADHLNKMGMKALKAGNKQLAVKYFEKANEAAGLVPSTSEAPKARSSTTARQRTRVDTQARREVNGGGSGGFLLGLLLGGGSIVGGALMYANAGCSGEDGCENIGLAWGGFGVAVGGTAIGLVIAISSAPKKASSRRVGGPSDHSLALLPWLLPNEGGATIGLGTSF